MKKSFHFLWISQLCANLGDVFYIVGFIAILYEASESPFAMALLPFLNMIGRTMSSSVAPLLFHRFRLKQVLVVSQVLKTFFLLVLAIGSLYTLPLLSLFCLIFIIAFLDGAAQPASAALVPRLVEKAKLLRANSMLAMMNESTQLGGWALGGVLVAATSGPLVIWLTLALYIFSTCSMLCIVDETPFERQQQLSKKQQLTEGFQLIWRNKSFRTIHVMIVLESIANVVWVAAIMYLFVADVLQVSEAWWGYINAAFFSGLIFGGMICTRFSSVLEKRLRQMVLLSSIAVAIAMLAFGLNRIALLALGWSVFSGIFEQLKGILLGTWLQLKAGDEQLVNIYSAQNVLSALSFGVATLLAGALANIFPVQWLFIGAGVLLLTSAVYFSVVRKRFE